MRRLSLFHALAVPFLEQFFLFLVDPPLYFLFHQLCYPFRVISNVQGMIFGAQLPPPGLRPVSLFLSRAFLTGNGPVGPLPPEGNPSLFYGS